ncbi:MAG: PKD domain-containing protein [Gemmatimonadaceae bacterium]
MRRLQRTFVVSTAAGILLLGLLAPWRSVGAQYDSVRVDSVRPAPGERLLDIDLVTPGIQFRWCIRYTPFGGSQPSGTTRVDSASIAVQAPPQTLLYFRSRGGFPQVNQCGTATGASNVIGDTATVQEKGSYEASITAIIRFALTPNPNNLPPVFAGQRQRFVSPIHVFPSAAVLTILGDSVRTSTQVHTLSVQHDLGPGQDIYTSIRSKSRVGGVGSNATSGDTVRTTDGSQTVIFNSPLLNGPALLRYDVYTDSVSGLARGRDRAFVRAGVVVPSTVIQQPLAAPPQPYAPRFALVGRAISGMYVRVAACSGCDALGDSVLVAADSSWSIPAVGWPNAGTNTLTIVGRDSEGFTDSVSVSFPVAVNAAPVVQITSPAVAPPGPGRDSLRIGAGESLTFAATGTDADGTISTWSWDFGNQTSSTLQNPGARSYAAPGRYVVTVRAADDLGLFSARDTLIVNVRVRPVVRIIEPTDNASTIQRFDVAGRATPGATVTLTSCFGCTAQGTTRVAAGDSTWRFSAVNFPPAAQLAPIITTVSDTTTLSSADTVRVTVVANQAPLVTRLSPGADSVRIAQGDSVFFAVRSTDQDGTIASRQWRRSVLVLGTADTLGWRVFPDTGNNVLGFRAVDNVGDSTVTRYVVRVVANAPPTAAITAPSADTTIAVGDLILIQGVVNDPDGVASVLWDYGDGRTTQSPSPLPISYPVAGVYTVTLRATDEFGRFDVDTLILTVRARPVVRLIAPAGQSTQPQRFDVTGRATPGATVRITACTGCSRLDSTRVAAGDSSFTFATVDWTQPGPNNFIRVRVNDAFGFADSTTVSFSVQANLPPVATITAPAADTTVLAGAAITFVGTATDQDGPAPAVLWNFGDGRTATTLAPPAVTYATAGTFVVTLRATDNLGAIDIDTVVVTVRVRPTIRLITPVGQSTQSQRFDVTGRATPGATVRITACTGCSRLDSTRVAAGDSSFTFAAVDWTQPGPNNFIRVRVNDAFGFADSTTVSFSVQANLPPVATITAPAADSTVVAGSALTFVGTATDQDGPAPAVLWNFGDGRTATTLTPPAVTYASAGTFIVTLRATDGFGAIDIDTVVVTVRVRPTVRLITPAGQSTQLQRFDVTGRATPGATVRITACTGCSRLDSTRVAAGDSSFTFAAVDWTQPGPNNFIRVRVNDASGFADSTTVSFSVQANLPPVATITAPAADTTVLAGAAIMFVGTATDQDGPAPAVLWNFGDGRTATTLTPPAVTYATAGTFIVTLRATDNLGAIDVDTVIVTVNPQANRRPTVSITQPAGNVVIAVGDSVSFAATATDPDGDLLVVRWTFAPGDTVRATTVPNRRFLSAGSFSVIVRATDPAGAFAEDTVGVQVTGRGANVDITSPGSATRVDGHDVVFVLRAMTTQDLRADVNGDGRVDRTDVALVRAAFGTTVPAALRSTP